MFSKPRTVSHISKSYPRDDDKYKGTLSHFNGTTFQSFVILIVTVLFFVWWFILPSFFGRTLADVEQQVARLMEGKLNDLNSLTELAQDDTALVDFIRKNYVFKSAAVTNVQNTPGHHDLVEHLITKNLINTQVPGYFIEIGAHNGTGFTSTLSLDRDLRWNGLIVEPVASLFKAMLYAAERHRNKNGETEIIVSRATVSIEPHLNMGKFHYNPTIDLWGGLQYRFYKGTSSSSMVLCIPLYSLMLAAGVPRRVELLVLDIEGSELDVLKTLPFERLEISIIVVETYNGKEGPTAVQDFLLGKGYKAVGKLKVPLAENLIDKISQIIERDDVHSEYTIFQLNE